MQRVLIGLLLTVVLAVGVTATETWAAWRAGGVAYLPLDDAERETLLACGDPGARGLAKVIAQDVRVDCAIDVQLAWLAAHDGAPQVVKALERSTSARGELRRAWLAWLSGRRAPVSTALENPDLPVTDRRVLIAWLAGHRDLPVMHPRTREALAIQRLDMDGWIPEPWVTARALEGDEGMVRRAARLERELNQPLPCDTDAECGAAVRGVLRLLEPHPPLHAPPPLASLGPRGEDAAERLSEAVDWVRVDPARLGRLRPSTLLLEDTGPERQAWAMAVVAERAEIPHRWVRDASGVALVWEGPERVFEVCPGEGEATAADLGELALAQRRDPAEGESTVAVAGRLLRGLEQAPSGRCVAGR